jgi:hypothetical protein
MTATSAVSGFMGFGTQKTKQKSSTTNSSIVQDYFLGWARGKVKV